MKFKTLKEKMCGNRNEEPNLFSEALKLDNILRQWN